MDQRTIDTYNQMAREYDEETSGFWERFPKSVFEKFKKLANGKVLDLGCGPGRDGLILQEAGLEVVCLDASTAMLEIAKGRGLNIVLGDFMNLPFENKTFDGVWAYTSLLHIPKAEINKAFVEISRVLKSGGVLGLGLIEGDTELYRESSGVNMPRWFSFYKKEEVEELLINNGFKEVYFEEFTPSSKKYLNFIAVNI